MSLPPKRRLLAIALLVCGLAIAGTGATFLTSSHKNRSLTTPSVLKASISADPGGAVRTIGPAPPQAPVAAPVSLSIPEIGVRTTLQVLGRTSTGALQVPTDTVHAGWYRDSSRPGAVGPAVIAGHVDSKSGAAVFFKLDKLKPGDLITVGRSDGSTVRFQVERSASFPKDRFPTSLVYGATPDRELRLITCGGSFDSQIGSYRSNIVVFAVAI